MAYGASVDTFAFGVMLYQLLFNDFVFTTKGIQKTDYDGILRLPKTRVLSAECFDLLQKCLRSDPPQRPSFKTIRAHPFLNTKESRPLAELYENTKGILYYSLKDKLCSYVAKDKEADKVPHSSVMPIHVEYQEEEFNNEDPLSIHNCLTLANVKASK